MMNLFSKCLMLGLMLAPMAANAQTQEAETRETQSRLQVGGYGEAVFTRNFYSDNMYRYSQAGKHKDDPSHGRVDIPHAVIYLSYDFGKGWKMGSEIEFEHGATGSSMEREYEESGEWEKEIEKGGEIELEQFWIQKTFFPQLNLKVGHIVVPIGLTNAHHEPLNYFTVYRPEGEATILPCTWHQTGISIWGRTAYWRYEAQLLPGLDGNAFRRDYWIQKGAGSPFEFTVANKYAVAARVDNYSIPGLRIGVSGYYGHSMDNSIGRESDPNTASRKYKGVTAVGAVDFTYDAHNWIVRGNADYGYVGDADKFQKVTGRPTLTGPYTNDPVGKNAVAYGMEAGYNLFSQFQKTRESNQRFYVFGRYEYYDSYIPGKNQGADYGYTNKSRMAVGINYFPIKQVAIKAEYSKRFLKSQYNDEPSFSFGIMYEGFFTK